MKKRIIAFLCVLSMCMTSIMPVAAQGNEEALDKVPVINSLSVVTEPENGRDSMTGEDELCLEMNVSAPEGIVIQGIDLDYSIEEEHGISFELFEFFFNEEEIAPGKESADFSLTIAPGKYAISGKYFLEAIYIYYGDDWDRLTYYWDDEEDAFVAEEDDFSVIVDCDKDFDFTVLPHEFEDKADPELVSLKWAESVDEENINIMTELELEIECKDDKSGINYVVVEFEDETGEYTEDFTYSREDSEEAVLDGVITLRNSMRRAGTYRLSYIEIEDVLGRVTIYEPEYDATGKLIAMDGKEDAVSAYFYKVAKNNLQVKSVTVEEKEYAAGEDVKGYLTIYNPLNKEAVFNSDEWDIVYETEYNGETLTSRMKSVLEDEDIKIQPKSTYVLELENNLSIYTYPGERKLTEISYVNWEDESGVRWKSDTLL